MPDLSKSEPTPEQFDRLIEELISGRIERARYRAWEIEFLLDLEHCPLPSRPRRESILRQYQKAVHAEMENGVLPRMKLSEYLKSRTTDQGASKPVQKSAGSAPSRMRRTR